MTDRLDIFALIDRSQTDFTLGVQVDVSRVHTLFETLCLSVQSLHDEIGDLRQQLNRKADATDVARLSDGLHRNAEFSKQLGSGISNLQHALVSPPTIPAPVHSSDHPVPRPRGSPPNGPAEPEHQIDAGGAPPADFSAEQDALARSLIAILARRFARKNPGREILRAGMLR